MSSVPIIHAEDVLPQIVTFAPVRRAFVLHNSRRKSVEVMYVGNMITIPPVNAVAAPDPHLGPRTAFDTDGDPIPGTRVIEDIFTFIPQLGDEILTFDSAKAIRHILGIQKAPDGSVNAVATSKFAMVGLSLLPLRPSKEVWMDVAREGEKRAFVADVENAQAIVDAHDAKNAKRKEAGMDPVHGGREYDRARFLLQQYNELTKREVEEFVAPHHAPSIEADLEMDAFVEAEALKLAKGAAETAQVDEFELAKSLLGKPHIRKKLEQLFQIRKRGHKAPSAQELDQAIETGASTVPGEGEESTPVTATGE